jgi:hypothetical protein
MPRYPASARCGENKYRPPNAGEDVDQRAIEGLAVNRLEHWILTDAQRISISLYQENEQGINSSNQGIVSLRGAPIGASGTNTY